MHLTADRPGRLDATNELRRRDDHTVAASLLKTEGRRKVTGKRVGMLGHTAPNAFDFEINKWTTDDLAAQQRSDPDIAPAMAWISDNKRPDWSKVKSSSPALRSLWQQFESLIERNGAIYRIFHNTDGSALYYQYVVPAKLKALLLELLHADTAGHLKFAKCVEHVMRRAWWHTWRRDLKLFIQCCHKCNAYHRGSAPKQGKLNPMVLGAPAERWSLDLTGPHPMSNGFKYIFTAICPFSKYAIAVPIRNKEASTVAKVIVEHILLKWGLCFELLADQGGEFEADLALELYKLLGISKLRTSGYRPSTNGAIEAWHKVLNSLLAKVINEQQRDWSKWVDYVTFCYNATTHASTSFCPFFIMTGRQPLWNIDFVLHNVDMHELSIPEYTTTVLNRLDKAYALVRDHLQKSADYASTWYNRKVKQHYFSVGDEVRVYSPRRLKGLSPKWQSFYKDTGKIVKRLNDVSYVVHCGAWRADRVVHVDKLKLIKTFV